jgi:hypothetical protein
MFVESASSNDTGDMALNSQDEGGVTAEPGHDPGQTRIGRRKSGCDVRGVCENGAAYELDRAG